MKQTKKSVPRVSEGKIFYIFGRQLFRSAHFGRVKNVEIRQRWSLWEIKTCSTCEFLVSVCAIVWAFYHTFRVPYVIIEWIYGRRHTQAHSHRASCRWGGFSYFTLVRVWQFLMIFFFTAGVVFALLLLAGHRTIGIAEPL